MHRDVCRKIGRAEIGVERSGAGRRAGPNNLTKVVPVSWGVVFEVLEFASQRTELIERSRRMDR